MSKSEKYHLFWDIGSRQRTNSSRRRFRLTPWSLKAPQPNFHGTCIQCMPRCIHKFFFTLYRHLIKFLYKAKKIYKLILYVIGIKYEHKKRCMRSGCWTITEFERGCKQRGGYAIDKCSQLLTLVVTKLDSTYPSAFESFFWAATGMHV